MCRTPVKPLSLEVEHDVVLDDIWGTISGNLREMLREGHIRLSDRIRIGTVFTFINQNGTVLRTLDLS